MDEDPRADRGASERAEDPANTRLTIERQAREIEHLQRRLEVERFAEELRQAMGVAAAAGTIASPVTHSQLLEMIVETAAQVISAHAASLFLIDRESRQLVFEVALGRKAEEVKKFTVPLGHGIAGLVAVSGQPMAISDAEHDPRQASDIARSVGYVPTSILCVPLFYNDQVTGVLELLDKDGADAFTVEDMHLLGLFANQAAVAIEQSLTHRNLAALVSEAIESLGGIPAHRKASLREGVEAFSAEMEQDETYRRAVEMARLVQEISMQGAEESRACEAILRAFAEYLRTRPSIAGLQDMAIGMGMGEVTGL